MKSAAWSRPSSPPRSAFAGFRFPAEVIVVAVRWYLRYGLSYRDVEELLAERGIEVDHVTVYRWVLTEPHSSAVLVTERSGAGRSDREAGRRPSHRAGAARRSGRGWRRPGCCRTR